MASQRERPTGLRDQQKQFTRERLAESAARVIGRKGYANASIEEIATEAGASRATFYLHFSSKVEVVRALMGPLMDYAMSHYERLPSMAEPAWSDIRAWLADFIGLWEEHGAEIGMVQQAAAIEPEISEAIMDTINRTTDLLAPWVAACAGIDRDEAVLKVTLWILEVERTAYFWKIRQIPFERESVLDALADSVWASLRPPERS
jgi:AcrR family transcriptional regulator